MTHIPPAGALEPTPDWGQPPLLTTTEAAARVFRRPSTIRWWAHRGWLHPAAHHAGQPLYRLTDIWTVERDRRAATGGRPRRVAA